MSNIDLNNTNIHDIIVFNTELLTLNELLNIINYDINQIYVDDFWNNIQDDKWIYLDNELILWLKYKEVNKGKEAILKLLKRYFIEGDDYKILHNNKFDINDFYSYQLWEQNISEEKRGAHNKQYITLSPDCFKELCMYIGTNKSKEIKKYNKELMKIYKFYLKYQEEYIKFKENNEQRYNINTNNSLINIKKSRGRKIQKINPNNLDVVIKVYDNISELIKFNENLEYKTTSIKDAIRKNTIYKGYRWCYVEKNEDPKISKAIPNNKESKVVIPIVQLNNDKNQIIKIYNTQEECYLNNGLTKHKLKEIIKNKNIYNNSYFLKIYDCDNELLETYSNNKK
jgi:hypothetical protein